MLIHRCLGGVFDEEFQFASKQFFKQLKGRKFQLVVSEVVEEELLLAPKGVKGLYNKVSSSAEVIRVSEEAIRLRDGYMNAKIVPSKYKNDALHVALATVLGCKLIVSWNFKHIVHFDKIPLYNAVNVLQGYSLISIFSPLEVIRYEEEKV